MTKLTLSYQRDSDSETSSGEFLAELNHTTQTSPFEKLGFLAMISKLCQWLHGHTIDEVYIRRTDREGLVPYRLDQSTVDLIREDPVAAAEAMSFRQTSPSSAIKRVRERNVPIVPQPVRIGLDVLSDAFGEDVYFRVRAHELECPGCGFWGMFTTPGLLGDPDRVGEVFKTVFTCKKKCQGRFVVMCWEKWGSVRTEYLLDDTKLDVFYFPRPWNDTSRNGWIVRTELQAKFDQFKKEKE